MKIEMLNNLGPRCHSAGIKRREEELTEESVLSCTPTIHGQCPSCRREIYIPLHRDEGSFECEYKHWRKIASMLSEKLESKTREQSESEVTIKKLKAEVLSLRHTIKIISH